jgi:hypothetical protein
MATNPFSLIAPLRKCKHRSVDSMSMNKKNLHTCVLPQKCKNDPYWCEQLSTLILIASTGAMLPIGVRKLGCDIVHCTPNGHANTIYTRTSKLSFKSISMSSSFIYNICFTKKRLIIDGASNKYFTQETSKLQKPLYQLSRDSKYAYMQVPKIINRWL